MAKHVGSAAETKAGAAYVRWTASLAVRRKLAARCRGIAVYDTQFGGLRRAVIGAVSAMT
jgi:hypothetical protein